MKPFDQPFHDIALGEERFYKTKLHKGGEIIACSIWFRDGDRDEFGELSSDQIYGATFDGEDCTIIEVIEDRFIYMHPIEESEYKYLRALSDWRLSNPESKGPPQQKAHVDFNTMELPF